MTNKSINLQENRLVEQYFFTDNFINNIITSFKFVEKSKILCLCTPSIANGFYLETLENNNNEDMIDYIGNVICLDSDDRFSYLPKFKVFDLLNPSLILKDEETKYTLEDIEYILFDPPFFGIKLLDLRNAVDALTNKDYNKKLLIVFSQRDEKNLIFSFKEYNLKPTKLQAEYKNVNPSKWSNVAIYSNFELGKIKINDIYSKLNSKKHKN